MSQLIDISTRLRERSAVDAELKDFVALTKAKLLHPSCSNLSQEKKDQLLEVAISEFRQSQTKGTPHGNH